MPHPAPLVTPEPLSGPESSRPDASPAKPAAAVRGAGEVDNLAGGAWMLGSVVAATVMTVAVRELSGALDSRMTVLLRSLGILTLCLPLLALPQFRRRLRFSRPGLHLTRGALIAVSTQLGFYGISQLPLATATVLNFTAPIFATMLSVPINGERVGPRRWAAVAMGFLGALIILRPGLSGEAMDLAMLAALGSAVLFALALALSRGIVQADGTASSFLSSMAITALVAAPLALPVWKLPDGTGEWSVLIVLLAASTSRSVADLQGYRLGEASVMGAISYGRLVLIAAAAWVIFDEVPDLFTVLGGAVIIGSTLYLAYRDFTLRRARAEPKAPPAE